MNFFNKLRKVVCLSLIALFCFNCANNTIKEVSDRKIINSKGEHVLLGKQTVSIFRTEEWFKKTYAEYSPNVELTKKIKKNKRFHKFIIFISLFEEDSKNELPKIIKVLDQAEVKPHQIEIYSVNKRKESIFGEEFKFGVKTFPTLIINWFQKEKGRFVGITTSTTVENEVLSIMERK